MAGIAQSRCSPTDTACICTDKELIQAITQCVALNCTIKEQLSKSYLLNMQAQPLKTDCVSKLLKTYLTQPAERQYATEAASSQAWAREEVLWRWSSI